MLIDVRSNIYAPTEVHHIHNKWFELGECNALVARAYPTISKIFQISSTSIHVIRFWCGIISGLLSISDSIYETGILYLMGKCVVSILALTFKYKR